MMSIPDTKSNSSKTPWTPGSIGCAAIASLLVLLVLAVVAWRIAYPYLYPVYAARYELRIDVETPQGLKSGSSVMEARYGWQPTLGGLLSSIKNDFSGEAVFVDLGDDKNLVVTLTERGSGRAKSEGNKGGALDPIWLPPVIFKFPIHHKTATPEGIEHAKSKGSVTVPLHRLPLVISFPDITNPRSVKRVDPHNLEATFGLGYRIADATIKMTDSPLLATIETKLPWLEGFRSQDHLEPGETIQSTPWAYLITAALRRGERQKP